MALFNPAPVSLDSPVHRLFFLFHAPGSECSVFCFAPILLWIPVILPQLLLSVAKTAVTQKIPGIFLIHLRYYSAVVSGDRSTAALVVVRRFY